MSLRDSLHRANSPIVRTHQITRLNYATQSSKIRDLILRPKSSPCGSDLHRAMARRHAGASSQELTAPTQTLLPPLRCPLPALRVGFECQLFAIRNTIEGKLTSGPALEMTWMTHHVSLPHSFDALRKVHSITSSARTSSDGGISKPMAFAVLLLTTVSYLVGACTGKSAALAPRRMWSI
jgi:hypothetical protein